MNINAAHALGPSRSIGVVRAELSSQFVCSLSRFWLYLLLTLTNDIQNNKTASPYTQFSKQNARCFTTQTPLNHSKS